MEDFIGGIANSEAVGRTSDVTGSLTLAAATVPAAEFEAKVASITSDRSMRDGRFQGIMDTQQFPTATFTVTKPIDLGSVPADGAEITASATGDLTLHGTKKSVTFDVKAKRVGGEIEVNGSIPVVFADYGIAQPTSPIVDVRDNGQLEFLLVFTKS